MTFTYFLNILTYLLYMFTCGAYLINLEGFQFATGLGVDLEALRMARQPDDHTLNGLAHLLHSTGGAFEGLGAPALGLHQLRSLRNCFKTTFFLHFLGLERKKSSAATSSVADRQRKASRATRGASVNLVAVKSP